MTMFDSLPCEMVINILEYIQEQEDIKSCRLVCHFWYSFFDRRCIRDHENFVFRSGLCSTEELSEVLLNYGGSEIHINLTSYDLEQIKFQDFGKKIRGLQLTHCRAYDEQTLENIFTCTPNLVYFYFDEFCLDWGFRQSSKFPDAFIKLCQRGFRNNNLRSFETNDAFTPISEMYEIFPHLESLRFEPTNLSAIVTYNIPIKKDLKELARIRVSMGKESRISIPGYPVPRNKKDVMAEQNFLMSLPKFKRLEIDFWYTRDEKKSSLDICLDFFTQQMELESLNISFRCQDQQYLTWTYQNTDIEHKNINCRVKNVLFHVLKSCRNLKILHFNLHCENLQFSDEDMQEFTRALRLTKIKELEFPIIALFCDAFMSHLASLQNLEYLKLHEFHHTNKNQGRKPLLSLTHIYEALSVVLRSNENLKRLKTPEMYLFHAANIANNEELRVNQIYHDKLERLEFSFQDPDTKPSLVEYLMSWELPNLSTLKLAPIGSCWHERYVADSETKNKFMKWIEKMPLLKNIDLRFIWLTIDDILEICKRLPRLQVIWFENTEYIQKEKLRKLFINFPNIRKVIFVLCQEGTHEKGCATILSYFYLVNRQKKLVHTGGTYDSDSVEPFLSL